jgi:hypothetical protein
MARPLIAGNQVSSCLDGKAGCVQKEGANLLAIHRNCTGTEALSSFWSQLVPTGLNCWRGTPLGRGLVGTQADKLEGPLEVDAMQKKQLVACYLAPVTLSSVRFVCNSKSRISSLWNSPQNGPRSFRGPQSPTASSFPPEARRCGSIRKVCDGWVSSCSRSQLDSGH